jgi:3-oxoacyl-[acyl-carrier protein] reductase
MNLINKRAWVCGSTQGIGKACAAALAAAGATVTLIARHREALVIARDQLPHEHGQSHDILCADFKDWQGLRAAAAAHLHATGGPVHILINNTGGPAAGRAIEARPEEFADAFAMHILCGQALVQSLAPGMREANYGRIVNIISTSVITPIKGLGVSNTIRGAVANWGRTLADELGPHGITVNNILPGFTDTARLRSLLQGRAQREGASYEDVVARSAAQIPTRRFAEPREIAAVIAFLCSPDAAYVNGVNLPIDGGRLASQ